MTENQTPPPVIQEGRTHVAVQMGGEWSPQKTNMNCNVCRSDVRHEIENLLLLGRGYRQVIQQADIPEHESISTDSLGRHYRNGHMPPKVNSVRSIVEARAREVKKANADGDLVDGVTLMRTVVQQTFEAIAKGEITPNVRDGVRAATVLANLGDFDSQGVDEAAYVEAYQIFYTTAKGIMSEKQWGQFTTLLAQNERLQELSAQFEGQTTEAAVEDPAAAVQA